MKKHLISVVCIIVALGLPISVAHHKHEHKHEHKHHSEDGSFEDENVKDRSLDDWEGNWQSIYPYLVRGDLDKVLAVKAEKGDQTVEEYRAYYLKGYQTALTLIEIDHDEIKFHSPHQITACHYRYSGKKILNYASGRRGVRYLFECTDSNSTAPKYIQFSDHMIAPAKSGHFHMYMGNDSHEQLALELTNWPTFYPASLSKEEIIDEMIGHNVHHGAHQHGVAQINLSIEGKKIELELQGALANFISFEYAPHSDAEFLEVKEMVNTINDPQKLFILSRNAECSVGTVKLSSDVISDQLLNSSEVPQPANPHSNHATHGNLSVNIEWQCRHPEKLKQVDVALFKYFPNLEQIDVQMVTPSGQGAMKLLPKETRIQW